ncbi:unnamed protein product, partial [Hapterophycus canaliculatus]
PAVSNNPPPLPPPPPPLCHIMWALFLHQVSVPFAGVLPFGAVLVELVFVMTAMWEQQLYYIFGFLMSVMLILTVTCAEISIVMCYFQLCAEDYRW